MCDGQEGFPLMRFACQVLKRMCRSLYRYPDPEAAELAKETLKEIRNLGLFDPV